MHAETPSYVGRFAGFQNSTDWRGSPRRRAKEADIVEVEGRGREDHRRIAVGWENLRIVSILISLLLIDGKYLGTV